MATSDSGPPDTPDRAPQRRPIASRCRTTDPFSGTPLDLSESSQLELRQPDRCNGLQTPTTSRTVAQPRCGSGATSADWLLSVGDGFSSPIDVSGGRPLSPCLGSWSGRMVCDARMRLAVGELREQAECGPTYPSLAWMRYVGRSFGLRSRRLWTRGLSSTLSGSYRSRRRQRRCKKYGFFAAGASSLARFTAVADARGSRNLSITNPLSDSARV